MPGPGTTPEEVQDVVGAMATDSATVDFTYDDTAGTLSAAVRTQMSLTSNASGLLLSGDAPTPGNTMLYGTNGSGVKGWYAQPAGGGNITGAGVANKLAVWSGASTQSYHTNLHYDLTTQRFGVGMAAPTGVLDVQGSVQASDFPSYTFGVRLWPVIPGGGVTNTQALRVEPVTGAGVTGGGFNGVVINDQPAGLTTVAGVVSNIATGTQRWNIYASGTAPNYFAGNVGMANSAPSYPLDVTGVVRVMGQIAINTTPGGEKLLLHYDPTAAAAIRIVPTAESGARWALNFHNAAGSTVGTIVTTSTATAYNTSSDVRLKHAVQPLTGALDALKALRPVKFRWNADDSQDEGFLAHELQQVMPHAVTGEPDQVNDDGSVKPQQVDASKLVVWLVSAVQELATRLIALETALGGL